MNVIRKSELRPVPWKTFDVAMGIALVVVGLVVLVIIYLAVISDPQSGVGFIIAGGATGGILILGSLVIGPVRYGASLGSLGLKPQAPSSYFHLILPLLVLAASLAFSVLYASLMSLLGWDVLESPLEELDLEGPTVIGGLALVVVLWGPLAEEVFFRGFVFSGLMGQMGFARAAVASSLLFALFHLDPRVMVPIFVTGMLLAWLYHRTGSLWSCCAAHAMQNALAFSISAGI